MMLLRAVARTIVLLMCLMIIAGCDRQTSQTDSSPAETEQVKTAAEYKAEADQQITEENMTSELDSLEKEIDADAATAP